MIRHIKLINLPLSEKIPDNIIQRSFVLTTCQRTIIFGLHNELKNWMSQISSRTDVAIYLEEDAYQFLLEVVCGLKSQVIAENEIVDQYKRAYETYRTSEYKNSTLLTILEKILKDMKYIRTHFLLGINQKSYAYYARKLILENNDRGVLKRVLVLGSGQLAIDLINQFKKHCDVYISARNEIKIGEILQEHEVFSLEWQDEVSYLNFSQIINTIPSNTLILNPEFFSKWEKMTSKNRCFVDLASPIGIDTQLTTSEGVYRLNDVLKTGEITDQIKLEKINLAIKTIKDLTVKRFNSYTLSFPFGWEDLKTD